MTEKVYESDSTDATDEEDQPPPKEDKASSEASKKGGAANQKPDAKGKKAVSYSTD